MSLILIHYLYFDSRQHYILYFCQCQKMIFHIHILTLQGHYTHIYLSILILTNCWQAHFLFPWYVQNLYGGDCMDFLGPVVYFSIPCD